MSLRFSEWKGYLVCLSLGKKKNTGFKCVKCVLSKVSINRNGNVTSRMKKQLVSEEELDQFVKENKKFLTKAEDYLRCENPWRRNAVSKRQVTNSFNLYRRWPSKRDCQGTARPKSDDSRLDWKRKARSYQV